MSAAPDYFAQKTPAELSFFIENPALYEPALVEEARRELRRRGLAPSQEAPATAPYQSAPAESGRRTGTWVAVAALVLMLGGGLFWNNQRDAEAAAAKAAASALAAKKAPPKLETVETNALPDFSATTAASVDQQLALVPAAEQAQLPAQPLRQYRELSRRFWTAETMSEHLLAQAQAGKSNPMLAEQTMLAREAWQQWNKAAVYSYKFGPVMTEHLDWMGRIASHQQHIMTDLPDIMEKRELLTTPELTKREDETQDLLSGLLPASPVTGKPYKATVIKMQM